MNINPEIPPGSVKYFSNARGVNYLPSLESEWAKSGYFPRVTSTEAIFASSLTDDVAVTDTWGYSDDIYFAGANKASIWRYYDEGDHRKSLTLLRGIGVNCIRVPLCYYAWAYMGDSYLENVKSFLKVCTDMKVRVQFIIWDSYTNDDSVYYNNLINENTALGSSPESQFLVSLTKANLREPNSLQASDGGWFSASAVGYLDALAGTVSSHDSMWSFDLCNQPTSQYVDLAVSTYNYMSPLLSNTSIKFTVSPVNNINTSAITGYLDNGFAEGPSGSYYNSDLLRLESLVDFISISMIGNNQSSLSRGLDHAINSVSGGSISKPVMVYDAYDSLNLQDFSSTSEILDSRSLGYMTRMGVVDSSFSFGNSVSPNNNIYLDGEHRDSKDSEIILKMSRNTGWFDARQLRRAGSLVSKDNDTQSGFASGAASLPTSFNSAVYVSATESKWNDQLYVYTNHLEDCLLKRKESSVTYLAPLGSKYSESPSIFVNSLSSVEDASFEDLLRILYNFEDTFPPLAQYPFDVSGSDWYAINETMVTRNKFIDLISSFIVDSGEITTPYTELRNSEFDSNPIPYYDRGNLLQTLEVMNDSYLINRNPTNDIRSSVAGAPTLLDSEVYSNSLAVYGVSDSGSDFSTYYDNYYSTAVSQLKKCLNWLFIDGLEGGIKIVSDSFLDEIAFSLDGMKDVEVYPWPASLTEVSSPLYQVEVFNESTQRWDESFVFVVSGQTRQLPTTYPPWDTYWAPKDTNPPISFTTFGVRTTARVRVTNLNQLTSFNNVDTAPKRFYKYRPPLPISENSVELSLKVGDYVYFDNLLSTSTPLCIFADEFKPSLDSVFEGNYLTYSQNNFNPTRLNYVDSGEEQPDLYGTDPALVISSFAFNYTLTGTRNLFSSLPGDIYFPPGIHDIRAGFPLGPSSTVYIDANAYLKGSFDPVSGIGSRVIGRGIMSAELYDRVSFIEPAKAYGTQVPQFFTHIGISASSNAVYSNFSEYPGVELEGIVLTNAGHYASEGKSVKSANLCKVISPWTYNSDGLKVTNSTPGKVTTMTNCFQMTGDDILQPFGRGWRNPRYFRNIFGVPCRSSCITNYIGGGREFNAIVKDIDIYCYAPSSSLLNPTTTFVGGNSIFTVWYDYELDLTYETGISPAKIQNWDVHGGAGSAVQHSLFHIGNQKYVYASQGYAAGRDGAGNWVGGEFRNINIPNVKNPLEFNVSSLSATIYGLSATSATGQLFDQENRPRDLQFVNFRINDEFLLDDNRDDWIAWINPVSSLESVTDPDSPLGADSNITFRTT